MEVTIQHHIDLSENTALFFWTILIYTHSQLSRKCAKILHHRHYKSNWSLSLLLWTIWSCCTLFPELSFHVCEVSWLSLGLSFSEPDVLFDSVFSFVAMLSSVWWDTGTLRLSAVRTGDTWGCHGGSCLADRPYGSSASFVWASGLYNRLRDFPVNEFF